MAKKKKTKIKNQSGYATTSLPSKPKPSAIESQPDPVVEDPPSTTAPATIETSLSPSIHPLSDNNSNELSVDRLVDKFKPINDRKADNVLLELDMLQGPRHTLDLGDIKTSFTLNQKVENKIVDMAIHETETDHFDAFIKPIRRRSSQTDKDRVVGTLDVVFRALVKLGFNTNDIEASMRATVSADIQDHLSWLLLHVPYERMPVGFYEKYYTEKQVNITLESNANPSDSPMQPPSVGTVQTPPDTATIVSRKNDNVLLPNMTEDHDKLWQILDQFSSDDEDYDVNKDHAAKRVQLASIDAQLGTGKSKKHHGLPPNEVERLQHRKLHLEGKLSALSNQPDFDKTIANSEYVTRQQNAAERRQSLELKLRKQSPSCPSSPTTSAHSTRRSSSSSFSSQSSNPSTLVSILDEDAMDEGLFGGLMEMMEEQAVSEDTPKSTPQPLQVFSLPLANIGNTHLPKTHLEEYGRKHGFLGVKIKRKCCHSKAWQATATLRSRFFQDNLVISLPPNMAAEMDQEADQLVSLWALFTLEPESFVYLAMASIFKDVWKQWKDSKFEEEMRPQLEADRHRFRFLIDTLEDSLDRSVTSPRPHLPHLGILPEVNNGPAGDALKKRQTDEFAKSKATFKSRLDTLFYKSYKDKRQLLPISDFRDEIIQTVNKHQVVVLSGETGCGKSTQLPQFLAEEILTNATCSHGQIICTQPRRISAMSIAQRVSLEMGDRPKTTGLDGSLVGYQIRMENQTSPSNVLVFCTTGILLRRLENDQDLTGIKYVIIDEVHERSMESDFLMVILQRIRRSRPDLRIVLMSATINAEKFSAYFDHCPMITVPGRTFPVDVYHLEDIVEKLEYTVEDRSPYAIKKVRRTLAQGSVSVSTKGGRSYQYQYNVDDSGGESNTDDEADIESVLGDESFADPVSKYSTKTWSTVRRLDQSKINLELLMRLIECLCLGSARENLDIPQTGAILVFLPGLVEIRTAYDLINAHHELSNTERFVLVALHSSFSSEQQQLAFESPPAGTRKIVLSTNIAETGVTISDVTIVIDSGMANIVSYNEKMRMTRMSKSFVAKANVNQRKGRAGRVQQGVCFRLFSRKQYQLMNDYETPEMLRMPLEELCLRTKVLNLGDIQTVLSMALDAPPAANVTRAIQTLQELQALADNDNASLTPLGVHLTNLPVDVHMGKMILFGATLQCLDPILVIAACLSYKSPFLRPFGEETIAEEKHKQFRQDHSDFHAMYTAYASWKKQIEVLRQQPGWRIKISEWAKNNYLSQKTLYMLDELKKQYTDLLISIGFVKTEPSTKKFALPLPIYNKHSSSSAMIHAAITAGLYPKISVYKDNIKKFVQQGRQQPMTVHPSSMLSKEQTRLPTPILVYNRAVMKNNKVQMWDAASITPLPFVLFAKEVDFKYKRQLVVVDNWVQVSCFGRTSVLVKYLRHKLNKILQIKMERPSANIEENSQEMMDLIELALSK